MQPLVLLIFLACLANAGIIMKDPFKLKKQPFKSTVHFSNWARTFHTNSPILFPTNDIELQEILFQARQYGYKVRPVGTGHSFDGLVQQDTERKIVVVSLANYNTVSSWDNKLNVDSGTIRMAAGRTFLDLMSISRPKGFLMVTQTAGWMFSLGGVFMNPSVHGATFGQDRLCSLLVAVRVMLFNGEVVEIFDEQQVRNWRGSMGLLGIVTALEIRLRRDNGIQMDVLELNQWSEFGVFEFLNRAITKYDAAEWFFNPYSSEFHALAINYNGSSVVNGKKFENLYQDLRKKHKQLALPYDHTALEPELLELITKWITEPLEYLVGESLVKLMMKKSGDLWKDNFNNGPRDGYYVDPKSLFKYNNLLTMVPCDTDCVNDSVAFKVLTKTREILNQHKLKWSVPIPIEFRFVDADPTVSAFGCFLEKKRYLSIEILVIRDERFAINSHAKVFMELEKAWFEIAPSSKVHLAKEWGYDHNQDDEIYPFQDQEIIQNVYSEEQKKELKLLIKRYDPIGLFSAGEGLRLVGLSNSAFKVQKSCNVM